MVLGDSISAGYGMPIEQGWVSLMNQKLIDSSLSWKMTNASISGETTGGALARLPELIETIKPSIVIIELGGNDGLRRFGRWREGWWAGWLGSWRVPRDTS